jgi:hypothetical protein
MYTNFTNNSLPHLILRVRESSLVEPRSKDNSMSYTTIKLTPSSRSQRITRTKISKKRLLSIKATQFQDFLLSIASSI